MRRLKHLPPDQWPRADHEAFEAAYRTGDIFDDSRGPGAHLAEGTRRLIETAYRRWLGFLQQKFPDDLDMMPADRIEPARVRTFGEHLSGEVRTSSVANAIDGLHYAARLIAPERDWLWLKTLHARLAARARPEDRFDRLVPGWQTLDLGITLMQEADALPRTAQKRYEIQYRDGLLLALLSCWPIRRRSIAALTVSRHLEFDPDGITIVLHPEDTKAHRADSFRVPEPLLPYLKHYLEVVRPSLLRQDQHDGLWVSRLGGQLIAGRIYDIARSHVRKAFGKDMGLHDFRRAAATHLAMRAPDLVGLTPGVLQHASPEVAEQHYTLARSITASQRFAKHRAEAKAGLRRPIASTRGSP